MERVEYVKPDFPADAFAGTAGYYVRYRPPYPREFLRGLIKRSGVSGEGRLLDLACGPGRVALALGSSFREIWAVDLEPEMIEAARKEETLRGMAGIRWSVGRAEGLDAPPASFELITVGEAFHRLDQRIVAERALQWLKPGGHMATMGCFSILSAKEPWQKAVVAVVRQWTGGASQGSGGPEPRRPGVGPEHDGRVLTDVGFSDVASHPFVEPHEWTADEVIGYLYSTSTCSRHLLGPDGGKFEADLRAALHAHDPGGVYREEIQWGFTLGRRP
jgi:SAM-dependent methyltransferase